MNTPERKSSDRRRRQYRIGEFTLDLDKGFLRRATEEIALRPKTFEVLTYLVQRPGCLVTKNELIEAVWPDTAITDNSLAQCLSELRKAMGDEDQQVIRTVARRGYIFADPVSTPEEHKLLRCGYRQVAEEYRVEQREYRGIGSNA